MILDVLLIIFFLYQAYKSYKNNNYLGLAVSAFFLGFSIKTLIDLFLYL